LGIFYFLPYHPQSTNYIQFCTRSHLIFEDSSIFTPFKDDDIQKLYIIVKSIYSSICSEFKNVRFYYNLLRLLLFIIGNLKRTIKNAYLHYIFAKILNTSLIYNLYVSYSLSFSKYDIFLYSFNCWKVIHLYLYFWRLAYFIILTTYFDVIFVF